MQKKHGFAFLLILSFMLLPGCGGSKPSGTAKANSTAMDTEPIDRTVPSNPTEKVNSDGVVISHSLSLQSEAKYPKDFKHFDYVNPNAPQGGDIVLGRLGTFDSFNRYGQRGSSAPSVEAIYDSLMVGSDDEINVYYGLIAEFVEYPLSYEWIIFHLHPNAQFHDGKKITASNVVFSFNKFKDQGVPQFKEYYKSVQSVTALDESRVRFTLSPGSKDLLVSLGGLIILPPQYWKDRDLAEPLAEAPLGSGPWKVDDFSMGQYVRYRRVKDYWGNDLPVNKGKNNFDTIRFDMYRDESVRLEALKAGETDFRLESRAKDWASSYTGPNFDSRRIIAESLTNLEPPSYQCYVYNISRPVFSDPRVREALSYTFDFEWTNTNLFYNQYRRSRSFFQNTPFEALGLPSEEEIALLAPHREKIPERVFTTEFQPPTTDGSGQIRSQISKAHTLLREAGWEIQDQRMINLETGEPLRFEIMIYSSNFERVIIPWKENLSKLGVEMEIRMVDTTQYLNRMRSGDYDMITSIFQNPYFPDSSLYFRWHSDYLDSTYNAVRVQDEVLDYLIEGIVEHQDDNQTLAHWGRALDRVLQWNFYTIPQWYNNSYRVAYWNKFSRPKLMPKYDLGFDTWWHDEEKAARISGKQ